MITNWHNVTGVNADTGRMLGSFLPNRLSVGLKVEVSRDGAQIVAGAVQIEIELYDGDNPVWLEHRTGRAVDCVAVPFDAAKAGKLVSKPINHYDFTDSLLPEIGMDCFIVGYPRGFAGKGVTPIWKRASIATEPNLDHENRPMMLVDTATREGMSGSPVMFRHDGIYSPSGKLGDDTVIGTVENLLGIYSGRIGDDELGVQLGRVWKVKLIKEILEDGLRGRHPNNPD